MKNPPFERNSRRDLFLSLCLLLIIPFLHQCVRTSLISSVPDTDGLGIAGHIEWFDLLNETLQAFLIVPLYHLLNTVKGEPGVLKQRIHCSFVVSTTLYAVFSIVCFVLCSNITQFMTGDASADIICYLRLETIAFIAGYISSFAVVVFVVAGKPSYIVALTVGRAALTILADLFFIPVFWVNGAACSNIAINLFAGLICFALVEHSRFWQAPAQSSANGYGWLRQWAKIGAFSGAQILLDNLIYALIVCKMVNDVAEQGNYWVANNFIWGFLLIPISALAEIIKRENTPERVGNYFKAAAVIVLLWAISRPAWKPFFQYIMGIEDPEPICRIVFTLLPFYAAYAVSSIFSNIFTAAGKTAYNCAISAVVNIGYYGIMYYLYWHGVFSASIEFICCLFGFGMCVNAICGTLLFAWSERNARPVSS
ncbi:hypothetical protein D1159_07855 [Pseudoflavonifractor sp. 524-17]|uniref:hypothetical protein n=1 Tax=Pseudoflavonifractor sp. 524-17 TaxID=2304577 RepID=UPI001379E280|nr:hypothetical protein [Pseudoflavonifractor sp. 524-17]NCE64499.1 hypothetical protein [Pseudoflavonifractor sp. 524-17]